MIRIRDNQMSVIFLSGGILMGIFHVEGYGWPIFIALIILKYETYETYEETDEEEKT